MRIAYDQQIFGWQAYGGISRYFCELAERLAGEPQRFTPWLKMEWARLVDEFPSSL